MRPRWYGWSHPAPARDRQRQPPATAQAAPARDTLTVPDVLHHAVYLRPAPALEAAVAGVHRRMERAWGLAAAGRFMPHVTLKGFFRTEAAPAELERRVAAALAGRGAVTLHQAGVVVLGRVAVVLDVHGDGAGGRNDALHALHEAVLDAVAPLVARDCRFTAAEYVRDAFRAHVTLAMADIPPGRLAAVLADARSLEPIGPPVSAAAAVQLAAFESRDWDGRWWESLTWRVLAELPLAPPVSSPIVEFVPSQGEVDDRPGEAQCLSARAPSGTLAGMMPTRARRPHDAPGGR